MKKRKMVALVLALCLVLCGCGRETVETKDGLSLWYVEGELPGGILEGLAAEYNSELPKGGLSLRLRAFPDEESLAEAFEAARPDLLLCSAARAIELESRGILREPGQQLQSPAYPDYIGERFYGVGRSFFPLGSELTLLYSREGQLSPEQSGSFGQLMEQAADWGRETGLPFFAADSYSALFYECMLSLGSQFHGSELDSYDENYIYVYNLLAEAAFEGGLSELARGGVQLVRADYLPCAAVYSTSLAGLEHDGFEIAPVPSAGEGRALLANCLGFAVTAREGRSLGPAAVFLSWLHQGERGPELALKAGLVPAFGQVQAAEDPLSALLMEIYESRELHIPDLESDHYKNRGDFEARFRAAIGNFS